MAAKVFAIEFGTKWPKSAPKISDQLDVLLGFLAEHWTTYGPRNRVDPSRLCGCGLGPPRGRISRSRAAMAFKLIESAQTHLRCIKAPVSSHWSAPARPATSHQRGWRPSTTLRSKASRALCLRTAAAGSDLNVESGAAQRHNHFGPQLWQ